MSENIKKFPIGIYAIIAGWALTLATLVWNTAGTNVSYALRLDQLEMKWVDFDVRLDTSEAYRMQLASSLAEIKTDLLWIRRELERTK